MDEIHHENSRNYDPRPIFQEKLDFTTNANDMLSKIHPKHKDNQTCAKVVAKTVNILDETSGKIRATLKAYENLQNIHSLIQISQKLSNLSTKP